MNVIVCKSYDEMSLCSAELLAEIIKTKPNCVLGLATGSTPVGLYQHLIKMNQQGKISFKEVTTVNLDEYYPISPTDEQSYRYFMDKHLFDHIDIDKAKTAVPDGTAADPCAACRDYEEMISLLGGIDAQILGVGRNGHIGFNEPAAALLPDTHVTDLTPSTIEANARFFADEADVPRRALTMGIGSIFKASKVILMASGAEKKAAVSALLARKLRTDFPVTLLNLHPDVTLICTADTIE